MRKYFQEISTGNCYTKYEEIANGIVLTKFDDKTGTPCSNSYYKRFVTKEELNTLFKPYAFKFDTNELQNKVITQVLPQVIYEIRNHGGITEEMARNLEEFYHSSPMSLDLYREIVKDEEMDTDDFIDRHGGGDDDYYYEESKQAAAFACALTKILKKAFIEYSEGQNG